MGTDEPDPGGGICKKRIAAGEQGKSGATQTLIAKKHQDALLLDAGAIQEICNEKPKPQE